MLKHYKYDYFFYFIQNTWVIIITFSTIVYVTPNLRSTPPPPNENVTGALAAQVTKAP